VQPYKESIFTITKEAQFGGRACETFHNDVQRINSGLPKQCCIEGGDWAPDPNMECRPDGTREYIQSYTENKVGGCPESAKRKTLACCYQKGDWSPSPGAVCKSTGFITQQQTTAGCQASIAKREHKCEYLGPWVKSGGCGSDGKQWYQRTVINSSEPRTKSESCCYKSAWGSWSGWGACNGSKRYKTRTRTVVNCPSGTPTSETGSQNCNHCAGYWEKNIKCWKYGGTRWGIPQYSKHTYDKYVRTKNASNGGDNSCPSNGKKGNWRTLTGSGKHGHEC